MSLSRSISRTPPSTVSANSIVTSQLVVRTAGTGFVDLTAEVAKFASDARACEGAVTLFIRHTSASLTIQENADPSVLDDLATALQRLAPANAGWPGDRRPAIRPDSGVRAPDASVRRAPCASRGRATT